MAKIDVTTLGREKLSWEILDNQDLYDLFMRSVFSNNKRLIVDRLDELYKFRLDQLESVLIAFSVMFDAKN
jgi:hypothetical protein